MRCSGGDAGGAGSQDSATSAQPTVTISTEGEPAQLPQEEGAGGRDFSELRMLAVVVLIAWGLFRNAVG